MIEVVKDILVKNEQRLSKLKDILDRLGVEYSLEEDYGATNLVVSLKGTDNASGGFIMLGAHYDLYQDSLGINDNSCSIALLLELIRFSKTASPKENVKIVFFDKEETGMVGSHNYASRHRKEIDYSIILDIIGYGDTLVYCNNLKSNKIKEVLKSMDIKELSNILPSDNIPIANYGIPVALIVALHQDDLYEVAEEIYELKENPKFYSSFHNRENDNKMELINFSLIEELRISLIKLLWGTKLMMCSDEVL
jgi:hypothetical protein